MFLKKDLSTLSGLPCYFRAGCSPHFLLLWFQGWIRGGSASGRQQGIWGICSLPMGGRHSRVGGVAMGCPWTGAAAWAGWPWVAVGQEAARGGVAMWASTFLGQMCPHPCTVWGPWVPCTGSHAASVSSSCPSGCSFSPGPLAQGLAWVKAGRHRLRSEVWESPSIWALQVGSQLSSLPSRD